MVRWNPIDSNYEATNQAPKSSTQSWEYHLNILELHRSLSVCPIDIHKLKIGSWKVSPILILLRRWVAMWLLWFPDISWESPNMKQMSTLSTIYNMCQCRFCPLLSEFQNNFRNDGFFKWGFPKLSKIGCIVVLNTMKPSNAGPNILK